MHKYIFASFNKNKHTELASCLNHINLISLSDLGHQQEIIESGLTLTDNALIKAQTIYNQYQIPSISDDTGLEIHALHGEPGVFSARYAGTQADAHTNIEKVLSKLSNVTDRRARFRTVICLKTKMEELFFEGVVNGVITHSTIGHNGFGYDPIFIPDGHHKTFSQMTIEEKNQISHRGQAIKKLIKYLSN